MFPVAIGGSLTTDRVCAQCNSHLGTHSDAALVDSFLIRSRRTEFNIAGNSGSVPLPLEILAGKCTLADKSKAPLFAQIDPKTGKLDLKVLPHSTEVLLPNGEQALRIVVDARDRKKILRIIRRERKKRGLRALTDDEMIAEIARFSSEETHVDRPQVMIQKSIDLVDVRRGILKIIYELAFLWLGESFLDDPTANVLRSAILEGSISSLGQVNGYIGEFADCEVFRFWNTNKRHHLAYSSVVSGSIFIALRLFDVYAAVIVVSEAPSRYLKDADANDKLRHLCVDAANRTYKETSFMEENLRIAKLMTSEQRLPPFADLLSVD